MKHDTTVITGGGSGVGAALARQMTKLGLGKVFAIDRNKEGLDKLAAEVKAAGGELWTYVADLTDPKQVEAAFKEADKLGRLSALVAAAGLGGKTLCNTPRDHWNTMVNVNLIATMDCCNQAAQRMARSHGGKGGRVVTFGSLCLRAPDADNALYASTKGAVQMFTDTWRRELKDEDIDVTLYNPGGVATPLNLEKDKPRLLKENKLILPDDVAEGIVFCLTRRKGVVVTEMFLVPSGQQALM